MEIDDLEARIKAGGMNRLEVWCEAGGGVILNRYRLKETAMIENLRLGNWVVDSFENLCNNIGNVSGIDTET